MRRPRTVVGPLLLDLAVFVLWLVLVFATFTNADAQTPSRACPEFPAPPDSIRTPMGTVPVIYVPDLRDSGDSTFLYGQTDFIKREIKIRAGMSRAMTWQVLGHEVEHLILQDAGLQTYIEAGLQQPALVEKIADANGFFLAFYLAYGDKAKCDHK